MNGRTRGLEGKGGEEKNGVWASRPGKIEGTAEESRAGSNSITSIGGGGEKRGRRTGFANDATISTDLLFFFSKVTHLTSIVM